MDQHDSQNPWRDSSLIFWSCTSGSLCRTTGSLQNAECPVQWLSQQVFWWHSCRWHFCECHPVKLNLHHVHLSWIEWWLLDVGAWQCFWNWPCLTSPFVLSFSHRLSLQLRTSANIRMLPLKLQSVWKNLHGNLGRQHQGWPGHVQVYAATYLLSEQADLHVRFSAKWLHGKLSLVPAKPFATHGRDFLPTGHTVCTSAHAAESPTCKMTICPILGTLG